MGLETANELMIKGVSLIGKARSKHVINPQLALKELNIALQYMNEAVDLDENDIELRKERLRHFVGVTMNSPMDLHEIILKDLTFFRSKIDTLTREDMSFYYFIVGNYHIYIGDDEQGRDMLLKCIKLIPESLEAKEAELIIDSLYQ